MFGLIFVLATAAAPPAIPAEGTYNYAVTVGGSQVGKTAISLTHTTTGMQLGESASATFGPSTFAGTGTLALDGALTPIGYTAVYSPRGRTIHAAVTFKGDTASETSDTGGATFNLAAGTKNFVILDGTMFAGFFIFPAQLQAWSSPPVTAISPMFGRSGSIAVDAALKPDRPRGVPAADIAVSVSEPVQFTIWYDRATMIVDELDVPQQEAAYIRQR